MKNQKKGFTLIELLVVIAIIGLLATLSVVALNNARERARDSRRVSDVKQMQTALELYFNANNVYPDTFETGSTFETETGGTVLMDPVPTPPTPDDCDNNSYDYIVSTDNDSYCLEYCLGNDTGGIDGGDNIFATPNSVEGERETCDP